MSPQRFSGFPADMSSKYGVGGWRKGASTRRDERGETEATSTERKGKRFVRLGGMGRGHTEGDKGRKIHKKGKTQEHTPANIPTHADEEGAFGRGDGNESPAEA